MFTSHGFCLHNIETFCSTHPNALPFCSAVNPHSSKSSESVTSDRSLTCFFYKQLHFWVEPRVA